jgi:hypothetical protein
MRPLSHGMTFAAASIAAFACTVTSSGQSFADHAKVPDPSTVTASHAKAAVDATPGKLFSASVHDGVLTVDGLVAKVHLNYSIKDQGYLYFFLPGSGTAIVSLSKMSGAVREKAAIHGSTLTVLAGSHTFQLSCAGKLLDGEGKATVYVRFDPETALLDRNPMMGFGNDLQAPYKWPVSRAEPKSGLNEAHFVPPPPVPVNLLPKTEPTRKQAPTPPAARALTADESN